MPDVVGRISAFVAIAIVLLLSASPILVLQLIFAFERNMKWKVVVGHKYRVELHCPQGTDAAAAELVSASSALVVEIAMHWVAVAYVFVVGFESYLLQPSL